MGGRLSKCLKLKRFGGILPCIMLGSIPQKRVNRGVKFHTANTCRNSRLNRPCPTSAKILLATAQNLNIHEVFAFWMSDDAAHGHFRIVIPDDRVGFLGGEVK